MQADAPLHRRPAVLPQVDRLPGSQQQSSPLKRLGEAGAGQGRTDVGRHVVRALVIMHVGLQLTLSAQRLHPLHGHQGPQVGGQVGQHAWVAILVHGQRRAAVQAGDHSDAGVQAAGADLGVEGGGDVGEALTPGLQLQRLQVLTHPHRPLTPLKITRLSLAQRRPWSRSRSSTTWSARSACRGRRRAREAARKGRLAIVLSFSCLIRVR